MSVADLDADQLLAEYPEKGDDAGDKKGDDKGADNADNKDDSDKHDDSAGSGDDKGTGADDKGKADGEKGEEADKDDKGGVAEADKTVEPPKPADNIPAVADIETRVNTLNDEIQALKDDPAFKYDPDDDEQEGYSYKQQQDMTKKQIALEAQIADKEAEIKDLGAEMTQSQEKDNLVKQFQDEIDYLETSGKLPKIKDENDAKDPGVIRRNEVRDFINKHNNQILKDGHGFAITSIELGLTLMEAEEGKAQADSQAEADKKQAEDLRRKKGAFVGKGTGAAKGNDGSHTGYQGGGLDAVVSEAMNELD